MHAFEELLVWQNAQELTVEIYKLLRDNKDYGFKDQIQRASVSIMNNIAEGCDSETDSLFLRYLHIAKGSCAETRSMLHLSVKLGYSSEEQKQSLVEKTVVISKQLDRLMQSIERRNKSND